jgi:hypothetical protein
MVPDLSAVIEKELSAARTGLGSEGVGGTEHLSAGLDGVKTLPDHTDNGTGEH